MATRKESDAAREARWQAEQDLRTLQEAEKIKADKSRVSGAQKMANEQIKTLATVAKSTPARKTVKK